MPRVSVVIRCFNEEKHIGRLLSGIQEQAERDVEIIVVDSGSTDATLPIARRFPVRVVSIPSSEFSFGRSLNRGCAAATGEFIAIASAHVYPLYRDWLARLLAPFRDPQVGLVYGRQRGNEATRYSEQQVFEKWFPAVSTGDQSHSFCNNANAAVRRELWQRFPYDEVLTGLEDLAWAKQIREAGFRIAYEAEAEVVHVHEETWTRVYNRYRREAIALKSIYEHEHFGLRDFLRLYASNVATDVVHAAREDVLAVNLYPILMFRFCQFFGTWRGFRQHGKVSSELKQKFYYPRAFARQPPARRSGDGVVAIDYSHIDGDES
jgi:glycosyltransferase involved in cell wall biosynthesis